MATPWPAWIVFDESMLGCGGVAGVGIFVAAVKLLKKIQFKTKIMHIRIV